MQISARKAKLFRIKNRKGYACICLNHLTEGKTVAQAYDRMTKALKRNKIAFKNAPKNIKSLITSL